MPDYCRITAIVPDCLQISILYTFCLFICAVEILVLTYLLHVREYYVVLNDICHNGAQSKFLLGYDQQSFYVTSTVVLFLRVNVANRKYDAVGNAIVVYFTTLMLYISYLSALEVCSRRGAIQIHVYLPTCLLPTYLLATISVL